MSWGVKNKLKGFSHSIVWLQSVTHHAIKKNKLCGVIGPLLFLKKKKKKNWASVASGFYFPGCCILVLSNAYTFFFFLRSIQCIYFAQVNNQFCLNFIKWVEPGSTGLTWPKNGVGHSQFDFTSNQKNWVCIQFCHVKVMKNKQIYKQTRKINPDKPGP